jgi:hypothetical protein
VADIDRAAPEGLGRDPADADQQAGADELDETLHIRQAGRDLRPRRAPIR